MTNEPEGGKGKSGTTSGFGGPGRSRLVGPGVFVLLVFGGRRRAGACAAAEGSRGRRPARSAIGEDVHANHLAGSAWSGEGDAGRVHCRGLRRTADIHGRHAAGGGQGRHGAGAARQGRDGGGRAGVRRDHRGPHQGTHPAPGLSQRVSLRRLPADAGPGRGVAGKTASRSLTWWR